MRSEIKPESLAKWEIVVARETEEIETIRPIWEQMQRNESCPVPNADIDRFLAIAKYRDRATRPYIILLKRDGNPSALVIGRIEKVRIRCAIGYKTLFNPLIKGFSVLYGGLLGERNNDVCAVLVDKFKEMLTGREIDVVVLNHIATDSLIYKYARNMTNVLCRDHFPLGLLRWKSILPNSYDEFLRLRSKNTRHNIRRYQSRLADKYGERVSVKCFTQKNEIDSLFKDTVKIAEKTYQHGLGNAFVDDEETRILVKMYVDHSLLAAYVLYIDGKPCAFWNGIRYEKTFFTWMTGYDPAFQNDRLGFVLLLKVIEELCKSQKVNSIDFGFGDAQYKQNLCDISGNVATVYIFALRPYPVLVNILRSLTNVMNLSVKHFLSKFGAVNLVKRRWRNVLQKV